MQLLAWAHQRSAYVRSSKSSLPSLYPLHPSPHTMYTAVESWVKLGNEASAIAKIYIMLLGAIED